MTEKEELQELQEVIEERNDQLYELNEDYENLAEEYEDLYELYKDLNSKLVAYEKLGTAEEIDKCFDILDSLLTEVKFMRQSAITEKWILECKDEVSSGLELLNQLLVNRGR